MKIVYIAHPISGDIQGNLRRITDIVRGLNRNHLGIVPFVPYYADCVALNDNNSWDRERGIANDQAFFYRKVMDEVWLYGDRISRGMKSEVELALGLDIPVIARTAGTIEELDNFKRTGKWN